jgi:hypothetical protein
MMKTMKCGRCSSVSQVYSDIRVPVEIVTCEHCESKPAGSQSFAVANTYGTKMAFIPDTITR